MGVFVLSFALLALAEEPKKTPLPKVLVQTLGKVQKGLDAATQKRTEVPCDPVITVGPTNGKWWCDNDVQQHPNQGLREQPGDPGCPSGMARVKPSPNDKKPPSFCMDRYEASLVLGESEANDWSPYHNPGDEMVRAVSWQGAIPQQFINGAQAAKACARSGKRLCTDSEWSRACKGPNHAMYPYSWPPDRPKGSKKNFKDQIHKMTRYPKGYSAKKPVCHEEQKAWMPDLYCQLKPDPKCKDATLRMKEACVAQVPGKGVARTGSYSGCVTPDGIYDLVGNIHEWSADPKGTFRGGFYSDTTENKPGCAYATTVHDFDHWEYSTGFRCCADVKAP